MSLFFALLLLAIVVAGIAWHLRAHVNGRIQNLRAELHARIDRLKQEIKP